MPLRWPTICCLWRLVPSDFGSSLLRREFIRPHQQEDAATMRRYDPLSLKAPFIWHGGDYNPEQWPRETWDEDVQLMQQAQCNVLTLGVFSWVSLQPDEDHFTFEWLDAIMDQLANAGRFVCLATPTAAQPAWMSQRYPAALKSDA